MREQKPSGVIDASWLTAFIDLDLTALHEIPTILYIPLTNKKLRATKSSSKYLKSNECDDDEGHENPTEDNNDDDDLENPVENEDDKDQDNQIEDDEISLTTIN